MNLPGIALVAVALFCSAAATAAEPCRLTQVGEVRVTLDPDGATYVPVTLDGHEGYMILQLSNGVPSIFDGYVDELGLRNRLRRSKLDVKVGGTSITHQAKVLSTLLGRTNFAGWDYQIYPPGRFGRPTIDGKPLYGIMTSVFMNAVDLELNLGESRLKLFRPNECKVTPVYWDAEVTGVNLYVDGTGLMLFPIELEGKLFEGSLNTNSGLSTISSEATRRFLGFDETSPGIERSSELFGGEQATFRAMSLTAKGLDVRNARVRIRKMPTCKLSSANRSSGAVACGNVLAMTPFSIGTNLMKQLRIYVSVRDKKIYFTRAVPAVAAPAISAPVPAGENAGADSGPAGAAAR